MNRHSAHHTRALEMAAHLANLQPHRAEKLRTCGAWLQFRDYYSVDQLRLTAGNFCQQDKLCPLCACRRAGRMLRVYLERVRAVMTETPALRPYLVTLTVKDGPDLVERVGTLQGAYRQLLRDRGDWIRNRRKGFSAAAAWAAPSLLAAAGGVASVEVKRGSGSGEWHPHIHAMMLCTGAIDAEKLRAEWIEATRGSHVIDVRPFDCNQLLDGDREQAWDAMAGDFCEVFKYALKFGDMSLEDNYHAFEVLHGRRLLEAFGVLRGVVVPESLVDEPLAEDLPYVELLLRYFARDSRYHVARQFHVEGVSRG